MLPANKIVIGLFINYTLLSANASGEAVKLNKDASDRPSARQYCRSTGGTIRETVNPNEYICCYKYKCLLSNTEKGMSIILDNK